MGQSKKLRMQLDPLDRKLLMLLGGNARRTNQSLSDELGIAPSTCLSRMKTLKEAGIIDRFTIDVEPDALGFPLQALISVRLQPGARHLMAKVGEELRHAPEILQFFVLGGAEDFLVHIAAKDTEHIRRFVLDWLSANPAVAGTQTSLVFEHARVGPAV
ncbi:Lrp/AsnC family transcriptional regulator [Arthrobacter castelli]|uniref:Lrp/AsnC family transcriptional regulator n=1 Tax=Arthrobacter castelli TaxID=271431 RepID=UPI00047D7DFD|nr:Lrp/AsnC family transcriptional regulator [Arthrobacter castelli]